VEGKTKNEHFHERCVTAVEQKPLKARTLLCEGWDASAENLQRIPRRQWTCFTTLKSTGLVSLSKAQG
jgi:hypothetical protein